MTDERKYQESLFRRNVKHWWVSLIIGIISVALGIICPFTPIAAFATLTVLFIAAFLLGGISEIVFAISNNKTLKNWGWILTMGIVDLAFAIILLVNPLLAPVILCYLIGFWILFQSIGGIGMSLNLYFARVNSWGWAMALSILGVLLALLLLFRPEVVVLFTIYILSLGFLCYGIFRIYISIKMKSFEKNLPKDDDILEY